nr:MAG TPA: hemolysin [Caudoviricetes sp.]
MPTEIIVALIALCGSLCGSWLANRKTLSLMLYRLEQLEKKVDKHNGVIERTYKLEENERVTEEKIKVINHRIEDLEHMT